MTSDNLPAVRTGTEVAAVDTDSWVSILGPTIELANVIADTEFVPKGLRSAPAVAAAMLYGREVGLAPMTALNVTHVIEGKPGISAEAMRALILAGGHEIETVETTGAICTMRGRRRGGTGWTTITWTIDMARAAGVAGKQVWQRYPRQMLQARCTTELARLVFPDVIHGFRSVEELEDMAEGNGTEPAAPGADTTRVGRARRTAKKAAAAPVAPGDAPIRPDAGPGVPLPGEPGYDEPDVTPPAPEPAKAENDSTDSDASSSSEAASHPVDAASPTEDDDASDQTGGEPGEEAGEDGGEARSDARPSSPRRISAAQRRMILGQLGGLGVDVSDRDERLLICGAIAGVALTSSNDLTAEQASAVIDTLAKVPDREHLSELLDAIDASATDTEQQEGPTDE